jgi:hypothetical protein
VVGFRQAGTSFSSRIKDHADLVPVAPANVVRSIYAAWKGRDPSSVDWTRPSSIL